MTSKQAAELYRRAGRVPPQEIAEPATEYIRNTRRKIVNGIEFRSTLEADAYTMLQYFEWAGGISDLELQPRFLLQPKFKRDGKTIRAMTYRADFKYQMDGKTIVIECKGFRTEAYRMRRKLFLAKYPDVSFYEWTRETVMKM